MIRDIRERAEALAPFLHYDTDPYPVISDGRIKWILDAYTTTDRYPYGERADTTQLNSDSGLDHRFNYVRNSVKVVIDAYDGRADFYVMPIDDPIIEAYRGAFPELFTDFAEMPNDLKDHLRYPEDLFRVQTNMWSRYHVDAAGFYEGNDYWDVARDPGTAGASEGTQTTDEQGNVVATRDARIDPYYLLTQLPGSEEPEFILLRPFVPDLAWGRQPAPDGVHGRQERRRQTTASSRSSSCLATTFPNGPALVQGEIQSDPTVSQQETLLSGQGSNASFGSLTAIPIDGGLVYVRPFYVTSTRPRCPASRR